MIRTAFRWLRASVHRKVTVVMIAFGLVISAAIVIEGYSRTRREAFDRHEQEARALATTTAFAVEAELERSEKGEPAPGQLDRLVDNVARPRQVAAVAILTRERERVAAQGPGADHVLRDDEAVLGVLRDFRLHAVRREKDAAIVVAAPVFGGYFAAPGLGRRVSHVVVVAMDLSPVLGALDRRVAEEAGAALVFLVLSAFALHRILTRIVLRPVVALERLADRLQSGDWSARSGIGPPVTSSGDEIERLAQKYDRMAEEIQRGRRLCDIAERRFQLLAENVRDAFFVADGDILSVAYASPAVTEVWGKSADLVTGTPGAFRDAVHPDDRATWDAAVKRIVPGGAVEIEHRVIMANGGERWLSTTFWGVRDDDGRIVGVTGVSRDVTGRRVAEREVARLAAAVEHSTDITFILSTEGRVEYANPSFEKVTGFARAEVVGYPFDDAQIRRGATARFSTIARTIAAESRWSGRETSKKKTGESLVEEVVVSPIVGAEGKTIGYVTVGRDVTKETTLEEQMRHAQKMEAIGLLAGGVAHDFNNILQVIDGFASLAADAMTQGTTAVGFVREVRQAAARATDLTKRLLAFGRRQTLHIEDIDIVAFIGDTLRLTRRIIGEDIDVCFAPVRGIPCVSADRSQLEQVFLNLIVNARDAMPRGGRLTVSLRERTVAVGTVEPDAAAPGRYVVITIHDTGCGMTKETVARIFEPFFTTKPKDKGTGLGLSVVYGIIRQHGGAILVESEPENGTTFDVSLPASDRAARPQEVAVRPRNVAGTETVLLAEDEPQVRELAERMLRRHGYRVLLAENGEDAVRIFDRRHDEIACVVMDVVMPRLGGREAAVRIRQKKPRMPVLFTSGYAGRAEAKPGDAFIDDPLLPKPYDGDELVRRVRSLIDGGGKDTFARE